jgi:hypothetical protein
MFTVINRAQLIRNAHMEKIRILPRFAKAIASGHHKSAYAGKIAQGKPLKIKIFNNA